jgi:hypothetical protein
MSSINPNNVDGTYPIAGQDNDSQGFRNNFTNIKNNLQFAYDELTDLQSKAVLKSTLTGGSLNNDMAYAQLISPQLLKSVETVNNLGTKSGSFTISWADGHFQYYTTDGNSILGFSNWPTSAFYTKLRLQITTDTTNRTVTFPAAVSVGLSDIQGAAGQVVTLPTAGVYLFELTTLDNGSTITIQDLLRNYDIVTTGSSGAFTSLNVSGNVLASSAVLSGLAVNGNASVGLAGAVSGQFHSVVGNITQTTAGGAVYFNTTGNVVAGNIISSSATVNGIANVNMLNASGNLSVAGNTALYGNTTHGTVGAVSGVYHTFVGNITQISSGGAVYINTTGNVLAASVSAGQINTTGNVLAASVSAGQINTTGNVLAAGGILNELTVNGTTTRAGATVDSGYQIYKPTANVSIQANVDVSRVIVAPTPSGSISSFWTDVILPNVSTNGHTITVSSNVRIETFRVLSPWVGYTIDTGANVTLANNTPATFIFHSTENKWFRV